MEEMEKQQEKQTLGEDELEALAKDVTSKVRWEPSFFFG